MKSPSVQSHHQTCAPFLWHKGWNRILAAANHQAANKVTDPGRINCPCMPPPTECTGIVAIGNLAHALRKGAVDCSNARSLPHLGNQSGEAMLQKLCFPITCIATWSEYDSHLQCKVIYANRTLTSPFFSFATCLWCELPSGCLQIVCASEASERFQR